MPTSADERTELPTPRRRLEARNRGQVARSQDLTAAVLLLAAFVLLRLLGPHLWGGLLAMVSVSLRGHEPWRLEENLQFAELAFVEAGRTVAPIVLTLLAVVVATLYLQVGGLFSWQPLTPKLNKISPLAGLQRLFSVRSVVLALLNFGKLLVVAAVAYLTLAGSAAAVIFAFTFGFHDLVRLGGTLLFDLGLRMAVALLILALFDFAWQRYRHERDLRMTKEEVKDELRSMEGDPQIKRRRRQLQLQLALQRLRKDLPKADVVVTNPTHFAVAIQYDPDAMAAPKVVAKGADHVALRIRQLAGELGIPIVERKALARALYDAVDVGQMIPERFYRAIAEILAYIYELSGQTTGLRRSLVGA